MKKTIIAISFLMLAASMTLAAESKKPAAALQNKSAELKAWAEEVRGTASFGTIEGEKTVWKKLTKGHELKPQQFVRTGIGDSYVMVKLSNGCYTEVKAGTKIGISTLFKESGTVHHNITLKYGAIKAQVEASKGENDFSVTTPRGTLSARGSLVGLAFAGDRGLGARGYRGTWHATATQTGLRQNIQRGQAYTNANALAGVLASQQRDVRLGDPLGGLSDNERQNLIDNGGGRGVFNFDGGTNTGSTSFTDPAPAPLVTYWIGGGTYYVTDTVKDIAALYGSGDWTRGDKSGRWQGKGTTASGFSHTSGTWSGDIVNASGVYKIPDSTGTRPIEEGTFSGTAKGSGTYVQDSPVTTGGGSTSGTWEGGGTFNGTTKITISREKVVTGGSMETGGSLTNGGM